jgi:tetratricopeptide (TPR) repeat protein
MQRGDYRGAIAVLKQAVAAAPPTSLTYAYALFDLGRSLRLAGDPQAAIAILQQRLQIPSQTGLVRKELALAVAASQSGGAPISGPGKRHDKGKHKGGGGKGD